MSGDQVSATCDYCGQPLHTSASGWWLGADGKLFSCPADDRGHHVNGLPYQQKVRQPRGSQVRP